MDTRTSQGETLISIHRASNQIQLTGEPYAAAYVIRFRDYYSGRLIEQVAYVDGPAIPVPDSADVTIVLRGTTTEQARLQLAERQRARAAMDAKVKPRTSPTADFIYSALIARDGDDS